jgi:hypothetical protein
MLPGDRLVCAFLQPKAVGAQFKTWFLHVTIVPWFRLGDSTEQIAQGLSKSVVKIQPFSAPVGEEVRMGPKRNRPAHLLEDSSFKQIEKQVRNYLHKKRAWIVDETTKVKWPYRPHVTFQGAYHLEADDEVYCDRLFIVEQKGEFKEVVAEIGLK